MENIIKCYGYGDEYFPIYELWIAKGDKHKTDFIVYISQEKFDEFKRIEKEFFDMQSSIREVALSQGQNP